MLCRLFGKLDFESGQFCLPEVQPWWQNTTSIYAVLWVCAVCGNVGLAVKRGELNAFLGVVTEKWQRN